MNGAWRGFYPAVTTLFRPDESLDMPATLAHVTRLLRSGARLMRGPLVRRCCDFKVGEPRRVRPNWRVTRTV